MISPKNRFEEFFSKKHVLSSSFLNKMGFPVLRTLLTNSLIKLRSFRNFKIKNDFELELINNGIIVIPNFLPKAEFEELKKEFTFLISKKNDEDRNHKGCKYIEIKNDEFYKFPELKKLRDNKKLNRLLSVSEGLKKVKIKNFLLENIKFGSTEHQKQDRNNLFHADVHFHSHKVFYYMNDVTEEHGPFTYLKKSHKNNFHRLLYEFKRGRLSNSTQFDWRLEENFENEFFKKYLNSMIKYKFKAVGSANTLVIGNVHGFHKVGDAIMGKQRELIRMTFRHNPIGFLNKLIK